MTVFCGDLHVVKHDKLITEELLTRSWWVKLPPYCGDTPNHKRLQVAGKNGGPTSIMVL